MGGKLPPFQSLYYRYLYGDEPTTQRIQDFPYDVPFLSSESILKLRKAQIDANQEFWPMERIEAYLGKDIYRKRAAVSAFLWERFTEHPKMSHAELKAWAEVERLDSYLRQIPAWFREQHLSSKDIDAEWKEWLAPRRAAYEARHQELMKEILLLQQTK